MSRAAYDRTNEKGSHLHFQFFKVFFVKLKRKQDISSIEHLPLDVHCLAWLLYLWHLYSIAQKAMRYLTLLVRDFSPPSIRSGLNVELRWHTTLHTHDDMRTLAESLNSYSNPWPSKNMQKDLRSRHGSGSTGATSVVSGTRYRNKIMHRLKTTFECQNLYQLPSCYFQGWCETFSRQCEPLDPVLRG